MKILNRLTLVAAGLFVLLLSSCTEESIERTESYVPGTDVMQVYFPADAQSKFDVEPTQNSVEITVVRVKTDNAATVGLTAKDYTGVFTAPGSVDFAAGEAEKSITVTFEGLEVFEEYQMQLVLEEEFTNPYVEMPEGTTSFMLTVVQSDWKDYATGTYTSDFFESEGEQVLQYSEILDKYRFPNVWVEGYHWEFEWDGGAAVVPPAGAIETGYVHASYGMVSVTTESSTYDEATSTFTFDREWTVAAGSFGNYPDYYKITERF